MSEDEKQESFAQEYPSQITSFEDFWHETIKINETIKSLLLAEDVESYARISMDAKVPEELCFALLSKLLWLIDNSYINPCCTFQEDNHKRQLSPISPQRQQRADPCLL
jgi:hypothetical protein